MTILFIAVVPHIIAAGTLANQDLARAMQEPLAKGRDEVIYFLTTHDRLMFGANVDTRGYRSVYRPKHGVGFFSWNMQQPWGRVRLPQGVKPSKTGFSVLDPMIASIEGLGTDPDHNATNDPDGEDGKFREELITWIHARRGEQGRPTQVDRGSVDGAELAFRVQYVGRASRDALTTRVGRAHQKLAVLLSRTLYYDPGKLVYVFPCTVQVGIAEPGGPEQGPLVSLKDAVSTSRFARDLLIDATEQALIAALTPQDNVRNAVSRRFPDSDAGDKLRAQGVTEMVLGTAGVPEGVVFEGPTGKLGPGKKQIRLAIPACP
jgi:hypothetical protein